MSRLVPEKPRATQSSIPGGIRFVIPAPRHPFASLLVCFWLVGWGVGEVVVGGHLFSHGPDGVLGDAVPGPAVLFAFAWFCAWTLGGAVAIRTAAYTAAGYEIVSLASGSFMVRREAFGIGRTREYDVLQIRHLRVATGGFNPYAGFSRMGRMESGPIAFDYGSRTYRFGAGIDEAEATSIVKTLLERLPSAA